MTALYPESETPPAYWCKPFGALILFCYLKKRRSAEGNNNNKKRNTKSL